MKIDDSKALNSIKVIKAFLDAEDDQAIMLFKSMISLKTKIIYLTSFISMVIVFLIYLYTSRKISSLYLENERKNKLETIKAIVATYNHEIRNPLTISYLALKSYKKEKVSVGECLESVEYANERILKIVETIDKILVSEDVKEREYPGSEMLLDVS